MSSKKHLFIATLLLLAIVSLGWFVAIRPTYREATMKIQQTAKFRAQAANQAVRQEEIDKLAAQRDALQHQIDTVLKQIPPLANENEVSRNWAFPIDNVNVFDREYTAAADRPALPDVDIGFMVTPMTVNIVGTFDAIFRLVKIAESLPQLVRVTAITITCDRRKDEGAPIGDATIALEVVYESGVREDGV